MNSKVSVKKESKVTITIDGHDYIYTEDEARALYEGLCELFQTDKQTSKLDLDELTKYLDKSKKTDNQEFKKSEYVEIPNIPKPWYEIPWKQPDVWCGDVPIDQRPFCK